jgi:hypothetical protein
MEVVLFLAGYGSEMRASFDAGRSWEVQIFPDGTTITELVISTNRTFILAKSTSSSPGTPASWSKKNSIKFCEIFFSI